MPNDPIEVSIDSREAFALTVFMLQAVRPEGRAEERGYNRIIEELDLEGMTEAALSQDAGGKILAHKVGEKSTRQLCRASCDLIVQWWEKSKGKHGALVAVCLPLIERIETANRGG